MELLEIKKDLLLKLFNANYIIESNNKIILEENKIKEFKNDIIFCKKIDRNNKLIIIYQKVKRWLKWKI